MSAPEVDQGAVEAFIRKWQHTPGGAERANYGVFLQNFCRVLGLSSKPHLAWSLAAGGSLEDRPRYNKGSCFDPFPFPEPSSFLAATIRDLAEELDQTRKLAIDEVDKLTMTELYNLRDIVRRGEAMDLVQQARAHAARASILGRLHDQLDAAVAEAYCWPANLPPTEIIDRLVALNAERAAEETPYTFWGMS